MSIVVSAETKARISTSAARMPLPSATDPNIGKVASPKSGVYQGIRGILYPRREAVLYDILDDDSTIGELMASAKPYLVLFFFDDGQLFCGVAATPSELDIVGGYTPIIAGAGTYSNPFPCGTITLGVGAATMDVGKRYYYDMAGSAGQLTVDYTFGAIDPNSYILVQQLDGTILLKIDQTRRSGSESFYYHPNMGNTITVTRYVSAGLTNMAISVKVKCPVYAGLGTRYNPFPCGDGMKGVTELAATMDTTGGSKTYYFMGNQSGKFTFRYETSDEIEYRITYTEGTQIHYMYHLRDNNPGIYEFDFDPSISDTICVETNPLIDNNPNWEYEIGCTINENTDPSSSPVGSIANPLGNDSALTGSGSAITYFDFGDEPGMFQINYNFSPSIRRAEMYIRYVCEGINSIELVDDTDDLSGTGSISGYYDPRLGELIKVTLSFITDDGSLDQWDYSIDFTPQVVPHDGSELNPFSCGTTRVYDRTSAKMFYLGKEPGNFKLSYSAGDNLLGWRLILHYTAHNGSRVELFESGELREGTGEFIVPFDPTIGEVIRVSYGNYSTSGLTTYQFTVGCVE